MTNKIITTIIVLLTLAGIGFLIFAPGKPAKYDTFAKCLAEKGIKFYGAFWCPHCREQKALFGKSAQFLPYNECSTPDGQGQNQLCKDKGIQSYPTWVFPNGARLNGVISLEDLSATSTCPLSDGIVHVSTTINSGTSTSATSTIAK